MKKQATITQVGDRIAISTPFDRDFVDDLKNAIHYTAREWDRANKLWMINEAEAKAALEATRRHFEILDGRGISQDEIEAAQLDAEIGQIKANQEMLIEKQTYIEKVIAALNTAIKRYSYTSKSTIKACLARDRALLSHSLESATLPTEQLAELQIRGMAAALRLIDGGYKGPRGSNLRI